MPKEIKRGRLPSTMESSLAARDKVGVQDFVLLHDHRSVAEFMENLRKRFSNDLIYVSGRNVSIALRLCLWRVHVCTRVWVFVRYIPSFSLAQRPAVSIFIVDLLYPSVNDVRDVFFELSFTGMVYSGCSNDIHSYSLSPGGCLPQG